MLSRRFGIACFAVVCALTPACATQTSDGTMDDPQADSGTPPPDDTGNLGFDIPNDFVVPKDDTGNVTPPEDTGNGPEDTGNVTPPVDTGNVAEDTPLVVLDTGNGPVDTGNITRDTGNGPIDTGIRVDTGNDTGVRPDTGNDSGVRPDTGTATGCAAASDCASCTAMNNCGWCPGLNVCVTGTSSGPTGAGGLRCAGWAWLANACPSSSAANPCAAGATTCGGCSSNFVNCGWCHNTRRCEVGNANGSAVTTACSGANWAWLPNSCVAPSDPCRTSTGCGRCTSRAGCGWCDDSETCQTGSSSGPTNGSCRSGDWTWTNVLGICF